MENRSGKLMTNLSGEMAYQSFLPAPLPPIPPIESDNELISLLVNAHSQLSLLDGLAQRIPNMNLFVSMYVRKEALLSSQIEGTQATLDDVLDPTLDENVNRNVADVINYIKAAEFGIKRLESLPLCNRLIKEVHNVLMENVRGQEKNPGEFRYSQNWIGGQGSTLKTARYIPPNPQDMVECMSDLEKFMNANDNMDHLIRIALIHYQFESIHPFLDGNGRVGRLLITLYLLEKKILSSPALYISYYLKMNRVEYYDRMSEVRRSGNYEQWIKFFLRAVYESAADAIVAIDQLSALHNKNLHQIKEHFNVRSMSNALKLFEYLESNPIIETRKTSEALGVAYNTVSRLISIFGELGILEQNDKNGKSKIFSYSEYLSILRKDT